MPTPLAAALAGVPFPAYGATMSRCILSVLGFAAVLTAGAALTSAEPANKGIVGIGVMVGEPTGLSAKVYLRDDRAIDVGLGAAFVGGGIHVHADYLFHPWILEDRDSFTLPVYWGPGVRVIDYRASDNAASYLAVGARGVVGLLFDFKEAPLDAFVEAAGVLEFGFAGNGVGIALNAAAGARFYF